MLKALAIVAVLIAIAAIVVLVLASQKPDVFVVQRSIDIRAPQDRIVPFITDMRAWKDWSPYEGRDPDMKRTYSGAPSGKGAIYAWDGNKNVGSGRMEIIDSSASNVTIKLDFFKPFEAHNTAEFTLAPQGETTRVTWAMRGPTPFFGKIMHVFINIDRMVGDDFAAGLAKLKTLAEK